MIAMNSALRVGALLALAGLLAACSGAGSAPASNGVLPGASGAAPMSQLINNDTFDRACPKKGNVTLSPCPVKLTVSSPEAMVTVTAPSGDTISVDDKTCSKKDIAEVEGSGDSWEVVAGSKTGTCDATFEAKDSKGRSNGTATLPITNSV